MAVAEADGGKKRRKKRKLIGKYYVPLRSDESMYGITRHGVWLTTLMRRWNTSVLLWLRESIFVAVVTSIPCIMLHYEAAIPG